MAIALISIRYTPEDPYFSLRSRLRGLFFCVVSENFLSERRAPKPVSGVQLLSWSGGVTAMLHNVRPEDQSVISH